MILYTVFRWVLVGAWLTTSLSTCVFGQSPEDTLQLAAKLPALLESCELTFKSGLSPADFYLKVDGDKFYVRLSANNDEISGFDGTSHWHRRGGTMPFASRSKSNSRPVKQFTSHPLNAPYTWFFSSSQDAFW